MQPLYIYNISLDRRLGGHQSRFEHAVREKTLYIYRGSNLYHDVVKFVTRYYILLPELPRHLSSFSSNVNNKTGKA
jgi:hypothetical protein